MTCSMCLSLILAALRSQKCNQIKAQYSNFDSDQEFRGAQWIKFNTNMVVITQMFRDFINMLNKVFSLQGKDTAGRSGFKEESKQLKHAFMVNERKNMGEKCEEGVLNTRDLGLLLHNLSSKYLNKIDMERNKTGYTCCFENLSGEISDEVLEFGFDIFLMMATCMKTQEDIHDAEEYFSNASPSSLTQEIFRLNVARGKKGKNKRGGNQKGMLNGSSDLLPILFFLENKLQMEYQTIDAVLSTEEYLKESNYAPMIQSLSAVVNKCIHLKNCTALRRKMKTIGK